MNKLKTKLYSFLDEEVIENKIFYPNDFEVSAYETITIGTRKDIVNDKNIGFWKIKLSIMQNIQKSWDKLIEYLAENKQVNGISTTPINDNTNQFIEINIINSHTDNEEEIKNILFDLIKMGFVKNNEKVYYYTIEDYKYNAENKEHHYKYASSFFTEEQIQPN